MKQEISKYEVLGESLQGFYTVETFGNRLKLDRARAIYLLHRLRKLGFVKTFYGAGKRRIYRISLANKQRGVSYTDVLNGAVPSPALKIVSSDSYYVHGRVPSYEEALIYAVKQRDVRYLIASLALFRKISDWNILYKLAKKEGLVCEIAALYEVARTTIRKIRKMPKRFLYLALRRRTPCTQYLIEPLSSQDFKDIEKKWRVYVPLNRADLEEYRR